MPDDFSYLCSLQSPQSKDIKKSKEYWKDRKRRHQQALNVRATHNEHLRESDIAAEYLGEAQEDEDAAVILMALRNIAEKGVRKNRYGASLL